MKTLIQQPWLHSRRSIGLVAAALLAAMLAPPASAQPVAPPDLVALSDVDPTILQEIRYFTPHNFVGDPIDGYQQPMCILTREAAEGLKRAQQAFVEQGYTLKVYDCYRPQRAVDEFVAWGENLADQRMKPEFYPRVDKANVFRDGYVAERSGHAAVYSRGAVPRHVLRLPGRQNLAFLTPLAQGVSTEHRILGALAIRPSSVSRLALVTSATAT